MLKEMFCMLFFLNNFKIILSTQIPIVRVTEGTIQGKFETTETGKKFVSYRGIPYAEPPIGSLRFREPIPKKPWSGLWQANSRHTCLQYYKVGIKQENPIKGDEDCLYLNIFVPISNKDQIFDVIFHIHGGAFMYNSENEPKPDLFVENEMIFVTINYRLGPFGFLSTEDEILPGNLGLRDQVRALNWIKDNIHGFNGNPNSITLSGVSAGGVSVHLHYLSPLTFGLFHRGIAMSGSALNPWILAKNPLNQTKKLAGLLGCPNFSSKEIIDCLRTRTAKEIITAVRHFYYWNYNPFNPFGVVVDKWSENPFLPDDPFSLLKNSKVHNKPLIFSSTSSEGLYVTGNYFREDILEEIENKWNELIPYVLYYNTTTSKNLCEKIKKFYFNDQKISLDTFSILTKTFGDRLFVTGIEESVLLHSKSVNAPIYFYYFSYRGAHSASEIETGYNKNFGACHGDDFFYLGNHVFDAKSTEKDIEMSRVLISIWKYFTQSGIPIVKGLYWAHAYKNVDHLNVLCINSPFNITMKSVESLSNRLFWKSLDLEEMEQFSKSKDEL